MAEGARFFVFKLYLCLLSFIVFVMLICGLSYRIFYSQRIKDRDYNIEQQFKTIIHPSDAYQIKIKMNKVIANSYLRAKYKYNLSKEKAVIYYEEELVREGWVKKVKRFDWLGNQEMVFKKGFYELKLKFMKDKESYNCKFKLDCNDFLGKWVI